MLSDEPATRPDWTNIISRIANQRDKQAFETFFDHFASKVKAYGLSQRADTNISADELVQEVMLKVWQKAHTYNKELSSVTTWLYTLTRNCWIDQCRRTRTNISLSIDDLWYEEEAEPDPFHAIYRQRREQRVRAGLRELPQEQCQVLSQIYLQGKTQQETASILGIPLGTVKSRIRLAIDKLEKHLRST